MSKTNKIIGITTLISVFSIFFPFIISAKSTFSGHFIKSTTDDSIWFTDTKDNTLAITPGKVQSIRKIAVGIRDSDIRKIAIGIVPGKDTDNDALPDKLEQAIGTDPRKIDTDKDGHSDGKEIRNNYDPLGRYRLPINSKFSNKQAGRVFVQVEDKWQLWYINPNNSRRYLIDSDEDIDWLTDNFGYRSSTLVLKQEADTKPLVQTDTDVIKLAAEAIRKKNITGATDLFVPDMKKSIEYTLNYLSSDSRLMLGNLLSGSSLSSEKPDEKIYTNSVYFDNKKFKVYFHVKKQTDGSWKIENL